MKFLLHANQFTERGDSVTLMSISQGLRDELGIESIIAFPKDARGTNLSRVKEANALGHHLHQYSSRRDLEDLASSEGLTHNYVVSDGSLRGVSYSRDLPENFRVGDLKHLTQAVFRRYQPHGDVYAYISEWLFDWSQSFSTQVIRRPFTAASLAHVGRDDAVPKIRWVPHVVETQKGDGVAFRKKHGVPANAKLIGRVGGWDQFNDVAAQSGLLKALDADPELYAVMVNTKRFANHDRLRFLPVLERAEIWDFYDSCNLLVNGRKMGESFGFSIVEPLRLGKPVIAPGVTRNFRMDKHHIALLEKFDLLYKGANDLRRLIEREIGSPTDSISLQSSVDQFSQGRVMTKFREVFLDEQ